MDGWGCYQLTKVDNIRLAIQIWKEYCVVDLGFAEIIENVRWFGLCRYHEEIEIYRWLQNAAE